MKTKILFIFISTTFLIALLYLTSCSIPPTVEITGWCTENIDKSYWTGTGDTVWTTAFFDIWVEVNDPDGIDDIEYVEVSNPEGDYWVLRDKTTGVNHYDPEGGFFGGWRRYWGDTTNKVLLGKYTVLVRDSTGNEVTDTISFSEPGSLSGSGFLYSEEYYFNKSGGIEMLERAESIWATKGSSDLTIEFEVYDTRVYNGYVWFYDASGEYLTWSGFFKNTINSGAGLKTDGYPPNILQLQSTDLDLSTFTWNDISRFRIVLTDGLQYSPAEDRYDHLSISSYEWF